MHIEPPPKTHWKSVALGAAVAAALTLPAVADSWLNGPTKTYQGGHSLHVDHLVGNLSIAVRNGGPIAVQVSGNKERVDETSVSQDDGDVTVEGNGSRAVWDWRHWFDFGEPYRNSALRVNITVPRGTTVDVEELVGDAQIGDTMAPIHFSAVSTNSTIGKV